MRESLQQLGRFDPIRARTRFLSNFVPADTRKVLVAGRLAGFYVIQRHDDHLYLDHLYIAPAYQNNGLGGTILNDVKRLAWQLKLPVRLGALKKSRANAFYLHHGFVITHQAQWDIYYEFNPD